ncbi:DUF2513 domain-containing protein [Robertmurraya yapensis]|uniref:DUF2513 domain-containing protein n=2 Tax=Bacillaceae TaxID=186817 RepID=A0A431WKW5_9BACI|nr:DUF2513 domain-containing protein [Bacillus yapensis]RTR36248.1 DUF2513 domain-containing protein [Bacillus yapensis]TKT05751.1 DUF2513 domain-containing protein [Bacillus yapensis]
MKRDMELVRDLLKIIEINDDRKELEIPVDWDREVVAYHLKILDQAGFVKNNTKWADNRPMWIFASLTWDGHEFLDSIKDNAIWNKTKEGIKGKGLEFGSVPLEVIKEYAKLQIKNLFGLE